MVDYRGGSDHNGMSGHIKVYKRVRRNQNVISYFYVSDYSGINTDRYAVADVRSTLSFSSVLSSNRTSLVQINIISDNNTAANSNVIRMPKV